MQTSKPKERLHARLRCHADDKKTEPEPKPFYGWKIVTASFLAHLAYAEQYATVLGLFFKPFQKQFGWSRSALAAVQTIARVIEAATAPFVGPLIDRYGPRILMPTGAAIVGMAMIGVTRISDIWQFYLLRGVAVAVGYSLMGGLVTDVAINNWFIKKRGRAIAISRVGSNISNIIMSPVSVFVIAASGWQTMFFVFAVVTWVTVLIPSWILMRRRPEDMGQQPDGIDRNGAIQESLCQESGSHPAGRHPKGSTPEPVWSRREALMTGTFWVLAASFAVNSMAFQGINISIAPYIQDLGYPDTILAALLVFRSTVMAFSSILMGFLAERASRGSIRAIPFMIQALSVFFLLMARTPVYLWLGVAVYGLGVSGVLVTQEVVWANYFGRLSLGRVRSLGYLVGIGFGAAGPVVMNIVFDTLGSYRPAFVAIIGIFALAALLMAIAKPAKAKQYATAASP